MFTDHLALLEDIENRRPNKGGVSIDMYEKSAKPKVRSFSRKDRSLDTGAIGAAYGKEP